MTKEFKTQLEQIETVCQFEFDGSQTLKHLHIMVRQLRLLRVTLQMLIFRERPSNILTAAQGLILSESSRMVLVRLHQLRTILTHIWWPSTLESKISVFLKSFDKIRVSHICFYSAVILAVML